MSLSWNERILNRPAINTRTQKCSKLDLAALRNLIDDGLNTFKAVNVDLIAALASRLIARRAQSFRAQYGFKLLRKTNIALCRLNEINIVHVIDEFAGTIPICRSANGKLDMPTRDNYNYVLLRLQSLAALFLRIARCSRESSALFLDYISRNFFMETSVMCVGVLAEVWDISRQMCHATVAFYNSLHLYSEHFLEHKNWLSDNVKFPDKLENFLGPEWSAEWSRGLTPAAFNTDTTNDTDINLDEFKSDNDMIIELPTESKRGVKRPAQESHSTSSGIATKFKPKVQLESRVAAPVHNVHTDIGEVVERKKETNTKPVHKVKPKVQLGTIEVPTRTVYADIGQVVERKKEKSEMKIETIVSTEDIQAYVKSEKVRLTKGTPALMSADRWNEMQRKINHILVTSQGRNTVQMFKKFWSMAVLKKAVR